MTDLLIRGGTVVTAGGSLVADVAVEGGRISAVGPDQDPRATETIDATGLLVLPGCVDVHTHTRLAIEGQPDRFFQDSVAAAFGGTTTFLSFTTPSSGISDAGSRSLVAGLREWRDRTNGDAAVDHGVSLVVRGTMEDPVAELPAIVDGGVPTAKAFMVYDFRLDERRLFDAIQAMGAAGGMLEVHCEDPVLIDTAVDAALHRGNTAPRYHATTRSTTAEAVATHRTLAFAGAAGAPAHVVHLSSAAAADELRRAKAAGITAFAETCPHYLALTDERYDEPDPELCARYVISPPLRRPADREAMWQSLADGTLDLVATDHVPDRADREKAECRGVPFDRISNGAPGIETLLAIVYSEGVARGRITIERMVDVLATTPARNFGLERKGAIEIGRDADLVLFDPVARRTLRAEDLHHTSDYTPYEGFQLQGAVRSVFVRGRAVVRDGLFVGRRGFGQFVERRIAPGALSASA